LAAACEDEMINVHGVNPALPPQAPESVHRVAEAARTEPAGPCDIVEISAAARLAAAVHEVPEVRADLVARVKSQIDSGTYETPERLEVAVNRLMEELFPEL
jgi:negative regulator of flagellin synthesis FlgM